MQNNHNNSKLFLIFIFQKFILINFEIKNKIYLIRLPNELAKTNKTKLYYVKLDLLWNTFSVSVFLLKITINF